MTSSVLHLPFAKLQGLGNDFILIESENLPEHLDSHKLAQQICDRHFGIGADGLMICWPSDKALARMQVINADGSEPEMCGNGLRCFVRYLQLQNEFTSDTCQIETGAGVLEARLNDDSIRINMGVPILEASNIPALGFEHSPVIEQTIQCEGQDFKVTLVSMGNPHCVIWLDDLETLSFEYWGPRLEYHAAFPQRINVEFVEVLSRQQAKVNVWERGAGATLACGTGACAVLVAGVLNQKLEPSAQIDLPGGSLSIDWPAKASPVWMQGPAKLVFKGEYELEINNG